MSDVTILIAISFLFVMTGFFIYYIANLANNLGTQIVTGVVRGTSLSLGVRQAMLFQMWLPYQTGPVATGAFLAFAVLQLGGRMGDPDMRTLAYFAAFLLAGTAVLGLVTTISGFFQYRAVLSRVSRTRIDDRN